MKIGIKTGLLDGILGDYVDIDVGLDHRTLRDVIRKLTCKLCPFVVEWVEVKGINRYWGMKSKMVKHFHYAHPEIWAKLERD